MLNKLNNWINKLLDCDTLELQKEWENEHNK